MSLGKLQKKIRHVRSTANKKSQEGQYQPAIHQIVQMLESSQLDAALTAEAKLIEDGCRDGELMYWTAYTYFRMKDYDRSAEWVDHTLEFSPGHLQAEILLGRLCLQQDRIDDALVLFQQILKTGQQNLPREDLDALQDMLAFYGERGIG